MENETANRLPDVWCVIPHYGDDALLDRCLDSLKKLDYPQEKFNESRIIIINNNPPNTNLYYTAAINEGIRRALKARCEGKPSSRCIVWLLNNDTAVDPGCLRAAVECFQDEGWDNAGIVGSRNLKMNNPDFICWGGSEQCFPYGKHKQGYVSSGDLTDRTEEEWVTFSCVFLNIELIQDIGLLDGNLRTWCSDSDYCLRARAQGWKCFYEPKSTVYHVVGATQKAAPPEYKKICTNDQHYFFKKWISFELYNSLTQYPFKAEPE